MAHNKIVLAPTGEVLIDLTQDDVTEADVVKGKTFHKADGTIAEGAYEPPVAEVVLQDKTITENGTYTADEGYDGLGSVTVDVDTSVETEELTVELSMADGDQIVSPSENKLLSKVTVTKPSTMLPENIKEGVEIGGVVGTHVGGSEGENYAAQIVEGTLTELNPTILAGVTSIRKYAFYKNITLQSVSFPSSLTSIGYGAFEGCYNITSPIVFPKYVTETEMYSFKACSKIPSITLNEGLKRIGQEAFYDCKFITSINIPSTVTRIDSYAFQNCDLREVVIPDTVTVFSSGVFRGNTNLASVIIGKGINKTYGYDFYECTALEEITIPETLTNIGSAAFFKSGLKRINWHNGITQLGSLLFAYAPIEHLSFPTSISVIPSQVCQYCTSLKSVVIPIISNNIQNAAFDNCTALEYVDMTAYIEGTSFPVLGSNVFRNCPSTFEIRVLAGRKAALAAMTNWSTYADNIVEVS